MAFSSSSPCPSPSSLSSPSPRPPSLPSSSSSPPLLSSIRPRRCSSLPLPASPSTMLEFAAAALRLALEFAINVVGSPDPIRLLVDFEDLVANVIRRVLKEYGGQRRIPVLGGHPEALDLSCAAIDRTLSSSATIPKLAMKF